MLLSNYASGAFVTTVTTPQQTTAFTFAFSLQPTAFSLFFCFPCSLKPPDYTFVFSTVRLFDQAIVLSMQHRHITRILGLALDAISCQHLVRTLPYLHLPLWPASKSGRVGLLLHLQFVLTIIACIKNGLDF